MKKLFTISIFGLAVAMTSLTGCIKTDSVTNAVSDLPNVFGFNITKAGSFIAGMSSKISIQLPSISSGDFTVHYDLSGVNAASGLTAVVSLVNGIGTFSTATLNNSGATSITVTSITNSSGKTSSITSNNTKSMSVGSMTFTRNGTVFQSDEVHASLAGNLLTIHAIKWDPLTTADVDVYTYANAPITVAINSATVADGSGGYTAPGVAQIAAYGTISITSTTPLITGTFSFTTPDSAHFTGGVFTATAP